MSTANTAKQNINTQLVLLGFVAMTIAFAFVAIITNMIVNSKVNAFAANFSTQLATANQNNPVTVGGTSQSNSLGGCTSPEDAAASADSTVATVGGGTQSNALPWGAKPGKYLLPLGNYSQSNSSVTNTTSNNTYIKDSYNTNTETNTHVLVTNNGNDNSVDNSIEIEDVDVDINSHNDNSVDNSIEIEDVNVDINSHNDNSDNSVNTNVIATAVIL